jgi:hypothetical protein
MTKSRRTIRSLKANESKVLSKLLSVNFEGCAELREQINTATAMPTGDNDNYGSIYLKTKSSRPAIVKSRIPVEAITYDSDGKSIEVLLHVVDGLVNELEIFKSDGSALLSPTIDTDKLSVKVNR